LPISNSLSKYDIIKYVLYKSLVGEREWKEHLRMHKLILALLIIPIILFVYDMPKASYFGRPLSESNLVNHLSLKSDQIKDIIILPEEEFDQEEAITIIQRIDQLPTSILSKIKEQDIKIVLFEGKLTDQNGAAHLKGKVPRGYPETATWDDLPGIGGSKTVLVKIGASEMGSGHGSVNLEFHELAHSLQRYVYNSEKVNKKITDSWVDEKGVLFPNRPYFLNYKEEFFAECFAYYFYSDETRSQLKSKAPEMYNLLSSLQ